MKKWISKYWKLILAVCCLAAYFALLVLVAMTDEAYQYESSEPLLLYSDFTELSNAVVTDEGVLLAGAAESGVKLCAADLFLRDRTSFDVQFVADCAQEYAGTVLHVDLCGENYDTDEHEFTAVLKSGRNVISGSLQVGENAPEQAQFRIFTLDAAQFEVRDLTVTTVVKKELASAKRIWTVVLLINLSVALAVWWIGKDDKNIPIKTDNLKKVLATAFVLFLFLPMILGILSVTSDMKTDVALGGHTDPVSRPEVSVGGFFDGSFQSQFTNWFENTFKPRGVFIRTFNTIRYSLFNEGGERIVGSNNDIYQEFYLKAEMCIGDEYDFSRKETQGQLNQLVWEMIQVKNKLAEHNKTFIVYVTPNKAHFNTDTIPYKYKIQENDMGIRGVDYLIPLLKQNAIPYLYCDELAEDLEYPAWYTTGIHWSRPYEQICNNELMRKAAELTNKTYRLFDLKKAVQLEKPSGRDTDVYDLMNIWQRVSNGDYYEYPILESHLDNYDVSRILIQGGSFAELFDVDYESAYWDNNISYINYNTYWREAEQNEPFGGDWTKVPMGRLLDNADCVVVEMNEAAIPNYTSGFVQYLNEYLDQYESGKMEVASLERYAYNDGPVYPKGAVSGAWEDGWGSRKVFVNIQNRRVTESGLGVHFVISPDLLTVNPEAEVCIYVNGQKLYERIFTEAWDGMVSFAADELPENSSDVPDLYTVEIHTNASFVPAEIGLNTDPRALSVLIRFIGEVEK